MFNEELTETELFRLGPELKAAIGEWAGKQGRMSRASFIRNAVINEIKRLMKEEGEPSEQELYEMYQKLKAEVA